jgi:hypothetical protein
MLITPLQKRATPYHIHLFPLFNRRGWKQLIFKRHGVHSVANRNEHQGISLGVKCGRRVQLTTLQSWLCQMSK